MSDTVRINITVSKQLLEKLKKEIKKGQVSNYFETAVEEKLKKERQQQALKELFDGPPLFTDIKDPVKWVRELRSRDNKRLKHLKI